MCTIRVEKFWGKWGLGLRWQNWDLKTRQSTSQMAAAIRLNPYWRRLPSSSMVHNYNSFSLWTKVRRSRFLFPWVTSTIASPFKNYLIFVLFYIRLFKGGEVEKNQIFSLKNEYKPSIRRTNINFQLRENFRLTDHITIETSFAEKLFVFHDQSIRTQQNSTLSGLVLRCEIAIANRIQWVATLSSLVLMCFVIKRT